MLKEDKFDDSESHVHIFNMLITDIAIREIKLTNENGILSSRQQSM